MPKQRQEQAPALAALPTAYAAWRRSTLGRITDRLQQQLLLERIGSAEGLRVLDVGCGDGALATELAAAGAAVTGLDASLDMLTAARSRADSAGVVLDLVEGDAEHLPFPDAHFDVVLSVAALCFSTEPARPLGEMARVLRPGGRLLLGELARGNTWAALRRLKGWLGSPVWRRATFRSSEELGTLAARAGLREIALTGAIFYPPIGLAARWLAPLDARIGTSTTKGAAFLLLTATR